tara:strand:- start:3119 stop:4141 length:1023 start_codon:yes stop_codon:yes gene_type:complete
MTKLKNKFAIGCLVQWYEVDIVEEYLHSVAKAITNIENRKNVVVDVMVNLSQSLEEVDKEQKELGEIFQQFLEMKRKFSKYKIFFRMNFYPASIDEAATNKKIKPYTIADYRREFNEKYCEEVDVLMWGETDSLIPVQTFEILDNLHSQVKENTPKYVSFFSTCKMWDDSWKVIEHPDFTDKPFIEGDTENWWSLRYTMNQQEMEEINNRTEDLDVQIVNPYKFNGCGLVISSDVIKAGVNIPKSVFFIHEDTAFMNVMQRVLGDSVPQYLIKNVLLVHNRKHPDKRMYIKGEKGIDKTDPGAQRGVHDWYKKANKMCEHNAYNLFNQSKIYTWEDVFNE